MSVSVGKFLEYVRKTYEESWGYIWGQSGSYWSIEDQRTLEDLYAKDPNKYANYAQGAKYGARWIGRRVVDCSGLLKWAASQCGVKLPHGSNTMFREYLTVSGNVSGSQVPVGAAVFKVRNGSDYYHVGVYMGDGSVIEAQGTQKGVIISSLSSWHVWGKLKGFIYDSDSGDAGEESSGSEDSETSPAARLSGICLVDVPNDGTVNVRSGASQSTARLARLPEGTEVEVLSDDGTWSRVSYQTVISGKGYIMSRFLRRKG